MLEQSRVPDWIREFSYPGWTNVFRLAPRNEHLYPVTLRAEWKPQFNDSTGSILLLAKDGAPTHVIRALRDRREKDPWRFAQRELGDKMGVGSNEKLYRFASTIPGGKLYGSATANMLYDDPRTSRSLPGFYAGPLHEFLKRVLSWVLASMPQVEWVACLGKESWFLTCTTLGARSAANQFRDSRKYHKPVTGILGQTRITAFPLYHPAALGDALKDNEMEKGWRAFATLVSNSAAKGAPKLMT